MPYSFLFLYSFCVQYVFFDAFLHCLVRYLQPWITPSLFDNTGNNNIVDEWTFGQLQDRNTAQHKLKAHWDTWITEADFAAIAAAGYVSYDESICLRDVVDEFVS
jgi:aryl-phospho-beta-D-glucosidase BglC (GH1 family)